MPDADTYINTLRVRTPENRSAQVQLRLSTKLSGADLRPPGLAPAQILLVRQVSDPDPGRLEIVQADPTLSREWERAVRDALSDSLRRAVRPSNGRVAADAEAVIFRDPAEAWACWSRERVSGASGGPWWIRSLLATSDLSRQSLGRFPAVPRVWRFHPRLVPAMTGHLAAWDTAADVLGAFSRGDADEVLQTVCSTFQVSIPPAGDVQSRGREAGHSVGPALPEDSDSGPCSPEPSAAERTSPRSDPQSSPVPPWQGFLERTSGASLRNHLETLSPAHRELVSVSLVLHDRPVRLQSRQFRSEWRTWRRAKKAAADPGGRKQRGGSGSVILTSDRRRDAGNGSSGSGSDDPARKSEITGSRVFPEDQTSADRPTTADGRPDERIENPADARFSGLRNEPYTVTELGGVFYLVNVLDALDLPDAAAHPPVGEWVGAWAVLEGLARALFEPSDSVRPDDPLWRVLASLDGRNPGTPAGRGLTRAAERGGISPTTFRIPRTWLQTPHIDPPVEGRWTVVDGRLNVWTDYGLIADLKATNDPVAQVQEEWDRVSVEGNLTWVRSPDTVPVGPRPQECGELLSWWTARISPFVRSRIAAAIGTDDRGYQWLPELFRASGKLYTTETHVDLLLPLDAARIDARTAGLDRSPGWWPPGGRVVRFHFREQNGA